MKETKQQTINAFLDAGSEVRIPVLPKSKWHKILQKLGFAKKELVYNMRKIRVGNRERIASRALNLPEEINNGEAMIKRVLQLSKDNNKDLIYCAAVALQNDRFEPRKELLDALQWVDDELLSSIIDRGLSEIDIQNFMRPIILIVGTQSLTKTETL